MRKIVLFPLTLLFRRLLTGLPAYECARRPSLLLQYPHFFCDLGVLPILELQSALDLPVNCTSSLCCERFIVLVAWTCLQRGREGSCKL